MQSASNKLSNVHIIAQCINLVNTQHTASVQCCTTTGLITQHSLCFFSKLIFPTQMFTKKTQRQNNT